MCYQEYILLQRSIPTQVFKFKIFVLLVIVNEAGAQRTGLHFSLDLIPLHKILCALITPIAPICTAQICFNSHS